MGECCFLGKFKLQKDCYQSAQSKRVWGLVEVTCGLIHAIYSVPEWQAVKLIFFAPCRLDGVFISYFTTGLSLIKMNICQCTRALAEREINANLIWRYSIATVLIAL